MVNNLVGGIPTPLKNMNVNGKDDIPYGKTKCSKPPTSTDLTEQQIQVSESSKICQQTKYHMSLHKRSDFDFGFQKYCWTNTSDLSLIFSIPQLCDVTADVEKRCSEFPATRWAWKPGVNRGCLVGKAVKNGGGGIGGIPKIITFVWQVWRGKLMINRLIGS
jgi:hypothetical protein